MDPSLGNTGLADVRHAGPPKELKTFDRTIELGQTEYITKCSGEVGTRVKAKGNRAATTCSQKAFLYKRHFEPRCEGGAGKMAERRPPLLPDPHWQPVRESAERSAGGLPCGSSIPWPTKAGPERKGS